MACSPSPGTVGAGPFFRLAVLPLAIAAMLALTGCPGNPRTGDTFDHLADPGPKVPTPAAPPSEAGFLDMVRAYCGELGVGDATLGALLAADTRFRALTTGLFHGDLTNDQLIRMVAERHPAPDANVEAIGCIADQMQKCYSGRCAVPAERRLPEPAAPADLDAWDTEE